MQQSRKSLNSQLPSIQDKMHGEKVSVTLDPDTASPWVILSEDGRSVSATETEQMVLENGKRFTNEYSPCVLGKEGFLFGRHYWEVQALQDGGWRVGVIQESVHRDKEVPWFPEGGLWAVESYKCRGVMCKGLFEALTNPPSSLSLCESPTKLRVCLDYEAGQLSFYSADTMEHLYSFTQAAFKEKVFPFFCLWGGAELSLL